MSETKACASLTVDGVLSRWALALGRARASVRGLATLILVFCFTPSVRAQGFGVAAPIPIGPGLRTGTLTTFDTAALTVETWIRVNQFMTDHGEPVQYTGGNGVAWQFYLADAGSLRVTPSFFVGNGAATGGPVMTRGVWHHLAGTYDGQTIRLYVDGNLVAQSAYSGGIPGAGSSPKINCSVKMACDLDDVRVWNVARRADQIQCTKNTPFAVPLPAGLLGYWPIDNGEFDDFGQGGPHWRFPSLVAPTNPAHELVYLRIVNPIPSGAAYSPTPPSITVTLTSPLVQSTMVDSPVTLSATTSGVTPAIVGWECVSPTSPTLWSGLLSDGLVNLPGVPAFTISGAATGTITVTPHVSFSGAHILFRSLAGAECTNGASEVARVDITCEAPTFTIHPDTGGACGGGAKTFTASATSPSPLTSYTWQIAAPGPWTTLTTTPLSMPCDAGGTGFAYISPANSPTATIYFVGCAGSQLYSVRCIATNTCDISAISTSTSHVVCLANFNCAGGVSVQDIFDFLTAWFVGDQRADVNGASGVSSQDIFDFLAAWFQGC